MENLPVSFLLLLAAVIAVSALAVTAAVSARRRAERKHQDILRKFTDLRDKGPSPTPQAITAPAAKTSNADEATQKLATAEIRAREMLESIDLIVVMLDATGRITYCNDYLLNLTGWTREEAQGSDWFTKFLPGESDDVRRMYLDSIGQRDQPEYLPNHENPIVKKNGERRMIRWSNTPQLDASGAIIGVNSLGEDITVRQFDAVKQKALLKETDSARRSLLSLVEDQQLYEAALRRSSLLLEASQSTAKLGGWELDLDTNILYWTDETYHIHDTSPEEFNPTVDAGVSYFLPESRRIISEALEAAIEKGEEYDLVLETLTTKGRRIDVRTTCTVTRLEGRTTKLTGIFQDITEQKQEQRRERAAQSEIEKLLVDAEASRQDLLQMTKDQRLAAQALEASELRLSSIINSAKDGIITTDEEQRIVVFNTAAGTMFHCEPHEAIGLSLEKFLPADVRVAHSGYMQQFGRSKTMVRDMNGARTIRALRSDGKEFPAEASISHVEVDGQQLFSVVMRDMSLPLAAEAERSMLEKQFFEAQKQESLGILAGGIAHDFNNLLTVILGNTELALLELPDDSVAHSFIENIVEGSQRAADLAEQLLSFSGRSASSAEAVDLSAVTESMVRLLDVSVPKQITTQFQLMENIPTISGDTAQLRQVIMNLIINASDAIGQNAGTISISTGVRLCDRAFLVEADPSTALPPGTYAYLEVADTGDGMLAETRQRIYDPFFTTKFTGRGLGLSAVLGIIRGHHGVLSCESELGKGTTFRIHLPTADTIASLENIEATADTPWHGDGMVLVIDDDDPVRLVAARILEQAGFIAKTASGGREGIAMLEHHGTDIRAILLDMAMPDMNGAQTLRAIREINTDVPVIMCSGYINEPSNKDLEPDDRLHFLQKPYRIAELHSQLKELLPHSSE